jgi:hypothetical protein
LVYKRNSVRHDLTKAVSAVLYQLKYIGSSGFRVGRAEWKR